MANKLNITPQQQNFFEQHGLPIPPACSVVIAEGWIQYLTPNGDISQSRVNQYRQKLGLVRKLVRKGNVLGIIRTVKCFVDYSGHTTTHTWVGTRARRHNGYTGRYLCRSYSDSKEPDYKFRLYIKWANGNKSWEDQSKITVLEKN